jgi:predicted hotdog family 3-hydroxylacyl-ACP dehydratase
LQMTRTEIAQLIPHAGAMCLLDGVVHWDEGGIRCVSNSHRDAANPLRSGGQLPALCGIEYAVQAMAVHGGLAQAGREKPRAGYVASVRDVVCRRERMDDLDGSLVVEASQLLGDGDRVIYEFRLWIGDVEILSGRAAVVLDADRVPG